MVNFMTTIISGLLKSVKANQKPLDKIRIAGKSYNLIYVDGLGDSGSYDGQDTILIKNELSVDDKVSTLIHEILEIFVQLYDLKLDHQTISTLEVALFSILKDNNF